MLGRFGGASDPFSVDLGVHPTRVGPIRPDTIIKHSFGFAVFFLKTGPTQDGSNPDLTRPGLIQPVLERFGGAYDLFSADLGGATAGMDPIRPDEIMFFENGPDPRRIQPRVGAT